MKKSTLRILLIPLFLIFLGIFIYSGVRLWLYYSDAGEADTAYQSLQQLKQEAVKEDAAAPTVDLAPFENMTPDELEELEEAEEIPYTGITNPVSNETTYLLPEFEALYAMNPDLVGWITVPGTRIDYPVVQRPTQKDYYLYRNFQGEHSYWGCIYVRESCDVFEPSDNVVIYGHRMQDGSMFADLGLYERYSFWESHKTLQFDTLRGRHEYEIVCVIRISATTDNYPYHTFTNAKDELDFFSFWAQCQKQAIYDTGIEVHYGDKLISLYTCEYSQRHGRLVVIARRVD